MKAKNCTIGDLQAALDIINRKYQDNVEFKSLEQKGKQIQFTLRVKSSQGPGHRLGFPVKNYRTGKITQKRMAFACWHVHGDFFDALFKVNPQAAVFSGMSSLANPGSQQWITINGVNWQDKNIGSQMQPLYFSEACECDE